MSDLIVFSIDNQQFALDLSSIECVIMAVEITPLPAGENILGVINMHGNIIPLISARKVFGLTEREIDPADQFIICKTRQTVIAIWIDYVVGITKPSASISPLKQEISSQTGALSKIINNDEKIILVCDIEKLCSIGEFKSIAQVP